MVLTQFFFERFWVWAALAGQPHFYLIAEDSEKTLIVNLAIGNAKSTRFEIVDGFFECFLLKMLNSFRRFSMANTNS